MGGDAMISTIDDDGMLMRRIQF